MTLGPRGEIHVCIPLTPSPDSTWAQYFLSPATPHVPAASHLRVLDGAITYTTSTDDFEQALADIDRRVAGTNTWYFDEHAPAVEQRVLALGENQRATQLALEALRKRFSGM